MTSIILENISFSYGAKPTIKQISCQFGSGNFYSILGPNGSGKTTLLDLISGFLKPDIGQIKIDGTDILTLSKNQLAKKIALVSQDYAINFPYLVKDVVLMGRHPFIPRFSQPSHKDYDITESVMENCGIAHLKDKKINELSGGEKQRCVFARALCQDTPILLLDEAFSNMDIRHTLQMLNIVKRAVKEKNRVVISVFHDLNIASAWSDAVLMLKNGKIKTFGETLDVFTHETIQDVFNVESIVEFNAHVNAKQIYYPSI
ncbi:MAG: ABC transporter ATP-binding protein [Desulfobacula sp.]|nr:ABC transporter ATP-binding protein [Desulfobacula sp.]